MNTSPVARSIDLGRGAEEHAHRQHRAALDDHALGHFGAGADEAVVLDDHRGGLQRLQHAADADAAGDMAVAADLRAAADRGPGVDHGAAVDIGADIDEARHQHHAGRDIGAAAHHRARHGAEPGLAGTARRPSRRTSSAPCPTPARRRRRASARLSCSRNDSSTAFFSHSLTRQPVGGRLGHPQPRPRSSSASAALDGLARLAFGRRPELVAALPQRLDGGSERVIGHLGGELPCATRARSRPASPAAAGGPCAGGGVVSIARRRRKQARPRQSPGLASFTRLRVPRVPPSSP